MTTFNKNIKNNYTFCNVLSLVWCQIPTNPVLETHSFRWYSSFFFSFFFFVSSASHLSWCCCLFSGSRKLGEVKALHRKDPRGKERNTAVTEMSGFGNKFSSYSMTQLNELLEDDDKLNSIVQEMEEVSHYNNITISLGFSAALFQCQSLCLAFASL